MKALLVKIKARRVISYLVYLSVCTSVALIGTGFSSVSAREAPTSRAYMDKVHSEIKAHNYGAAIKLLEARASHGCAYSQSLLGLMHQKGLGCHADPKEAARWFGMAARRDFADAQFQLGKMYRSASRELAPEAGQAQYWLSRAAANGVTEAKDLIARVPGGEDLEYKVSEYKYRTAAGANAGQQGLTESWTGYANIVNSLSAAASNRSGNN